MSPRVAFTTEELAELAAQLAPLVAAELQRQEAARSDELLDARAVAEVLGVTQATVRRWANAGRLPARRVGTHWYVARGDLATAGEPAARAVSAVPSPGRARPARPGRGRLGRLLAAEREAGA